MGTELALQETIKDRIKSQFIDLIPDEHWDKLVSNGLADAEKDIEKIAKDMAVEHFRELFKQHLSSVSTPAFWNNFGEEKANELLVEVIKTAAPELFSLMIAPFISQFLYDLKNRF